MKPVYEGNLALKIDKSGDDYQFQTMKSPYGTYQTRVGNDILPPLGVELPLFSIATIQQTMELQFPSLQVALEEPKHWIGYKIETQWLDVNKVWQEYKSESELLDVEHLRIKEEESLDSLLIEYMSEIPEVESVYKYEDGTCTIFFTILSTAEYRRDINMRVYEVEYMILRQFPDVTIAFRCIPRLRMSDDDFLPKDRAKLFNRTEKSYYGRLPSTSDTSAA